MSEWISVEDRLPENEKGVLACVSREHPMHPEKTINFVVKAFYTDGNHNMEDSAYDWDVYYCNTRDNENYIVPEGWWEDLDYSEEFHQVNDEVTHWMSLPEPPVKGE